MLGLVGGAPGWETPRVADSSAAGAGRFFHNSVPPSKQNSFGTPPRSMCNVRPFNQRVPHLAACKTLANMRELLQTLQAQAPCNAAKGSFRLAPDAQLAARISEASLRNSGQAHNRVQAYSGAALLH